VKINSDIYQPWYNNELKKMQIDVRNAKHLLNCDKSDGNWNNYKLKRNIYKNSLRKAENNYILNKIETNRYRGKELWQILKSLYDNKKEELREVEFNNIRTNDEKEIAHNFNEFFVKSIKEIQDNIEILITENYIENKTN
jgi:hypothetical protein